MSIKDRILQFLETENIAKAQFERQCGFSNGYINSIKEGIGAEKLERILREYPLLRREWLLSGVGEMYISDREISNIVEEDTLDGTNSFQLLSSITKSLINEISAQRRVTEKAQEQIDRIITMLENKMCNDKTEQK